MLYCQSVTTGGSGFIGCYCGDVNCASGVLHGSYAWSWLAGCSDNGVGY